MKITIIRHGDPDYSIDSLTEKGWREARLLGERLGREHFDDIYCSTHGRARDTARPALEKLNMSAKYVDWLREVAYMQLEDPEQPGQMRGMWDLMPEFFGAQPLLHQPDGWLSAPIIKSTQIGSQYAEVCRQLDAVLLLHGYARQGNIYTTECGNHDSLLFFCHHGAGCVLISHLLNIPPMVLLQNTFLAPTSVTEIYTEERKQGIASMRCSCLGDCSHLNAAGEPISFSGRFCECYSDDTRH